MINDDDDDDGLYSLLVPGFGVTGGGVGLAGMGVGVEGTGVGVAGTGVGVAGGGVGVAAGILSDAASVYTILPHAPFSLQQYSTLSIPLLTEYIVRWSVPLPEYTSPYGPFPSLISVHSPLSFLTHL